MNFECTYIVDDVFFVHKMLENVRKVLSLYGTDKFNKIKTARNKNSAKTDNNIIS